MIYWMPVLKLLLPKSPEIADLLNPHLGLPFKPMKATPEGIEYETKAIPSATKPPESSTTQEETCAVTTSSGLDLSGLREVNWLARPQPNG